MTKPRIEFRLVVCLKIYICIVCRANTPCEMDKFSGEDVVVVV